MIKRTFTKAILILNLLLAASGTKAIIPGSSDDMTSSGSDMKVLTWNIYMLPHSNLVNSNHRRARGLAQELSRSDYTIIVFQEAFDPGARKIIREVLKKNFPFFYGPANNSKWYSIHTSSGLWIASRIPLQEKTTIRYTGARGFDRFANKGAILLEGTWKGQPFQLVATHIQSDDYPWMVREKQIDDLHRYLLVPYLKPGVPQIICGDFNTDKAETQHYQELLSVTGADDGTLEGNDIYSFSSPGNEITRNKNERPRLIDYILTRNSQFIESITRKIRIFQHQWKENFKTLSDHNAVEATIRFSPGHLAGPVQLP
jgi:endonuclease/exonuclease/phosphatase family metal-dependent hydrolase